MHCQHYLLDYEKTPILQFFDSPKFKGNIHNSGADDELEEQNSIYGITQKETGVAQNNY